MTVLKKDEARHFELKIPQPSPAQEIYGFLQDWGSDSYIKILNHNPGPSETGRNSFVVIDGIDSEPINMKTHMGARITITASAWAPWQSTGYLNEIISRLLQLTHYDISTEHYVFYGQPGLSFSNQTVDYSIKTRPLLHGIATLVFEI